MAALLLISGCSLSHKRPAYPDPERLVSVVKVEPAGELPILKQDFPVLRSESKTLESISAYRVLGISLTEDPSERIHSAKVTADFFSALGVKPVLGRALLPVDSQLDSSHVVMISYAMWQRRFGSDPNLIGRGILLDRERYIVVGIMPPDFGFPKDCDAWTPLTFGSDDITLKVEGKEIKRIGTEVEVFARLKPGVTLEQAQAEMRLIASRLGEGQAENNTGQSLNLTALRESNKQIDNVLEIKLKRPVKLPAETGKEK
jgi:hypothetical protein